MQQKPHAATDPLAGEEWPDPLASLRGLPDFGLEDVADTGSSLTSAFKDTPAQERAERDDPAPRTCSRVNTHVHLPPNFSAFETVEQAVDLAATPG